MAIWFYFSVPCLCYEVYRTVLFWLKDFIIKFVIHIAHLSLSHFLTCCSCVYDMFCIYLSL